MLIVCLPFVGWSGVERSDEGTEVADYRAREAGLARRKAKSVVDTNTVVRLGYELPDSVVVGKGGQKRVYAKGLLAQCAIGEPKRFELRDGGALALGSAGFRFDSNYARGGTNDVVFAGGAIACFEPSYLRSAAPIALTGTVRIVTRHKRLVRSSLAGPGSIVKQGAETLGLQYPCARATGRLVIEAGTVVFGSAASWGGTVVVRRGATVKCSSVAVLGRLDKEPSGRAAICRRAPSRNLRRPTITRSCRRRIWDAASLRFA